jgi:hypothetical protein
MSGAAWYADRAIPIPAVSQRKPNKKYHMRTGSNLDQEQMFVNRDFYIF